MSAFEVMPVEPSPSLSIARPNGRSRLKREQIFAGALEIFAQCGFVGASMDRVAGAAGVSKPTLYSHFRNKEKLFVSLFEWAIPHYFPEANSETGGEPGEWLEEQLGEWYRLASGPEHVFLLRSALGESGRFPGIGELYGRRALLPLKERLQRYLEAHPELPVADPEASALVLCCGMLMLVVFREILQGFRILPLDCGRAIVGLVDLVLDRSSSLLPSDTPPGPAPFPELPVPQDGPLADRREQILSAATAIFVEHGYAGTSMDMVALGSGVSKPTLYSYFQDKVGLFCQLIARVTIGRTLIPLQPLIASEPPAVVLGKLAEAVLTKIDDREYQALFRLVLGESVRFPEVTGHYVRTVVQPAQPYLSSYLRAHYPNAVGPTSGGMLFIGPLIGFVLLQAMLGGTDWLPYERNRYLGCFLGAVIRTGSQSRPPEV